MKPRVLLISLQSVLGGAETSLWLLVQNLRSRCAIHVACPPDGVLTESLRKLEVPVHLLPAPPRRSYVSLRSGGYWIRLNRSLVRAARCVRPHVIHANTFHSAPAAILAARLTGAKLLLHARDYPGNRTITRLCARGCDLVIAVSDSVKRALVEQGLPAEKIRMVYNGVEGPVPTDEGSRHRRERRAPPFVFGHVGQFVEWKRHIDFLRAAAMAARDLPDARFLLVGDDVFGRNHEYRRHVLRYARTCPIAERTTILGWQKDMTRVWPQIDCLVHTAEREPFGRVIIEAMFHEIPVIAVDRGGPSEILDHDRTGLLVPPRDTHRLVAAMVRIARDSPCAAALAAGGRQAVQSRFRADRTAEQIQRVYDTLLTEPADAHWAEPSYRRPEYLGR